MKALLAWISSSSRSTKNNTRRALLVGRNSLMAAAVGFAGAGGHFRQKAGFSFFHCGLNLLSRLFHILPVEHVVNQRGDCHVTRVKRQIKRFSQTFKAVARAQYT